MTPDTRHSWHRMPPEVKAEIRKDREVFNACVRYLKEHAAGEIEGCYGPDSMTWVLYREPAILLGGLRAILLQIADPAVAVGVANNSNFRNDTLGRARRTFSSMYQLIFGGLPEALGAAKRVNNLHARVTSGLAPAAPAQGIDTYRANAPDLLQWVLATLIDTALVIFETFVRPLSSDEKRRYYAETAIAAAQFGVLPSQMPPTLEDFYAWYNGRLSGDMLQVGDTALELASQLFNSPYTRGQFDEVLTAGLLPDRFRQAFRVPWNPARQRAWALIEATLRRSIRLTPPMLRYVPAWHQAQLRLALARGERPTLLARAWNAIDHHVDVPLSIKPVAVHAVEDDDED